MTARPGRIAPALAILLTICAAANAQRVHTLLDANWRFALDKSHPTPHGLDLTWQWMPISDKTNYLANTLDAALTATIGRPAAQTAKPGQDIFHGRRGFAWLGTDLIVPPKAGILHFDSVDDNATVYFNGKFVRYHEGWNDPFDVPLGEFKPGDHIRVDILDENTDGPGGIGAVWFAEPESQVTPKEAQPAFNDRNWRTVHLPHDYVLEGTFNPADDPGHGALARTQAWYRREIDLPKNARDKSVWIDFEGAYSDAHVWWNGHFLGRHRSGYTGFRFDLNKYAHFGGHNELVVHLDASKTEGWWYEGGGLYRHVWLTIANPVHIAPLGGVYIKTTDVDPKAAQPSATVRTSLTIDLDSRPSEPVTVGEVIRDPEGHVVSQFRSSAIARDHYRKQLEGTPLLRVEKAQLWSIEQPNIYRLETNVYVGDRLVDSVTTPFGIRTIRFDKDQGFFLNEKPVKLKGTCNHQDFAGVGIGMPDSILEWRIKKLKELGSNAYRCSHNEVAPELLDACDRLGMVVMDENREFGDTWSGKANERTTTNDLSDLRQEVLRDRNHPSVIMWSLGNEEFAVQTTPAGGRIARALGDEVRKLDPTRPITAALNGGHGHSMSEALDLEGFNYNPGEYTRYRRQHPDAKMFASETASTVTDRGEYAVDKVHGYVPAYDTEGTNTAEDAWQPVAEHPYMAGAFVWTGFDYKGEPSPYGWPCVNSHFGIIDMCGFWKDVAYYYKAWWGAQPTVHVFPNWTWPGQEGKPIKVWAFGNGDSVELIVNGVSKGRKPMPQYRHVEWTVPYAPGSIEVRSYRNGDLIATDRQETTGEPAALRVTPSKNTVRADEEDCVMLNVSVVDAQGRVVPNAANQISFTTTGPAKVVGVGNGDPSSHEPDRAPQRHAWHGLCLGILQATSGAGQVTVTISSPGLKPTTLTLPVTH